MNHKGKCALCRKEEELTFEHIPPRAAFNSSPAKPVSGDEILGRDTVPWDLDGLHYYNQQKGMGKYSLCKSCNNNTGAWYAQDYIKFAQLIDHYFKLNNVEEHDTIIVKNIHPLRLIKQIISMFCSINTFEDERINPLREFVLNKNMKDLDKSKYRICCYFTKSHLIKYAPLTVIIEKCEGGFQYTTLSEITAYPLGFILYFNPKESSNFQGIDITNFSNYDYDDIKCLAFPKCIEEVNNIFPCDYRSKEEIIDCIKTSKKFIEENLGDDITK